MNNKREDKEYQDFEKQLEDLVEWQENQYNPGHYVGTGRIVKFVKELNKYWLAPFIIGIFFLIVSFVVLTNILGADLSSPEGIFILIRDIIFLLFLLLVGIYGIKIGVQKYLLKRK